MKGKRVRYLATGMVLISMFTWVWGQGAENTADRMIAKEDRLTIGGYAQIDYQVFKNKANEDSKKQFNAGVAIWF